MNKLVYVIATLALLSTAMVLFNYKKCSKHLDGVKSEWVNFKVSYGKSYENQEVELYRFSVFVDNYKMIKAHDPSTGYTMAVNQFADLTNEEFKKTYLGYIPAAREKNYAGIEKLTANPPSSVNWVT